tara:strand:- start:5871 stop:6254 length:384 start_codon:yes stop_codon:yes gene_type:complete
MSKNKSCRHVFPCDWCADSSLGRLTKKDIALCFAERTGFDVSPKDIRIRGNWLFHRVPYDDQMVCYDVRDIPHNSGVLSVEAWDDCPLDESPFVPNNKEKVAKTLERLDKGYRRYLLEEFFIKWAEC